MKNKFISDLISLATLALLYVAIQFPTSGFVSVAAAAAWIMILLGAAVSLVVAAVRDQIDKLDPRSEKRAESIKSLRGMMLPQSKIRTVWLWTLTTAKTCMLAYLGMVFTSVVYFVVNAFCWMVIVAARDTLEKIDKEEAAAADPLGPCSGHAHASDAELRNTHDLMAETCRATCDRKYPGGLCHDGCFRNGQTGKILGPVVT